MTDLMLTCVLDDVLWNIDAGGTPATVGATGCDFWRYYRKMLIMDVVLKHFPQNPAFLAYGWFYRQNRDGLVFIASVFHAISSGQESRCFLMSRNAKAPA